MACLGVGAKDLKLPDNLLNNSNINSDLDDQYIHDRKASSVLGFNSLTVINQTPGVEEKAQDDSQLIDNLDFYQTTKIPMNLHLDAQDDEAVVEETPLKGKRNDLTIDVESD